MGRTGGGGYGGEGRGNHSLFAQTVKQRVRFKMPGRNEQMIINIHSLYVLFER